MVWRRCGAALAQWWWSEMPVIALAAHPRKRNAFCQIDLSLAPFVVARFSGWPATIRSMLLTSSRGQRTDWRATNIEQRTKNTSNTNEQINTRWKNKRPEQ